MSGISIAVIVPVCDESGEIPGALEALRAERFDEVIVVDGGSADSTRRLAADAGARVLEAPRGRATQMNAGARAASSDVLLFLHVDTRLPRGARAGIERAMADPRTLGGGFRAGYDEPGWRWRLLSLQVNLRSRLAVPWGDQALFVRRDFFDRTGGYRSWRLMEDVELARRVKREGRLALLPAAAVLSSRRFRKRGFLRTAIRNQLLVAAYYGGIHPDRLARFYPSERRGEERSR